VYVAADGKHLAVGPLEPKFYAQFVTLIGGLGPDAPDPYDVAQWPRLHTLIAARLATRTRAEWLQIFDGSDACVAPVLSLREATEHPQATARDTFVEVDGIRQPAPAPRFSATPASVPTPPAWPGRHTRDVLEEWAVADVDGLLAAGVAVQT
jgi:alpha-methylacyl-CoA racemase